MNLSDFDYHLPKDLIAQEGLSVRHNAKLMVLNPDGVTEHLSIKNLPKIFKPGDLIVMNNTKVVRSKMLGNKESGGKVDCLVLPDTPDSDNPHIRNTLLRGSNVRAGVKMVFLDSSGRKLLATVLGKLDGAKYQVEFDHPEWIPDMASLPLPPYIKKPLTEPDRYQTIYSLNEGSLAAPTAGLHFTDELIAELTNAGIDLAYLTLHIGLGTFSPIRSEVVEKWNLEKEYFNISQETAQKIKTAVKEKRRIFAVGTTTIRALESALLDETGTLKSNQGWTELYIYPGYKFKLNYSGMLTNFHLPKSTLLLLVSAFASKEKILTAYEEAVKKKYRFYSFGDAMLIFR